MSLTPLWPVLAGLMLEQMSPRQVYAVGSATTAVGLGYVALAIGKVSCVRVSGKNRSLPVDSVLMRSTFDLSRYFASCSCSMACVHKCDFITTALAGPWFCNRHATERPTAPCYFSLGMSTIAYSYIVYTVLVEGQWLKRGIPRCNIAKKRCAFETNKTTESRQTCGGASFVVWPNPNHNI